MSTLINYHVLDPTNIGDLLSSPLRYFDFPGHDCSAQDIRKVDPKTVRNSHIIIGGGGLLFNRFLKQIEDISQANRGRLILWGVGQQGYGTNAHKPSLFDYNPYVKSSDLIGIRDDDMNYPWVPCASCMHPAFDKPRIAKHKFVVFSHKKFQINFPGLPRITNENADFESVLDFLGSGETILTSSFHGAYWGILLGRKVLAFPFSSKFFTLRHKPSLYPVERWSQVRWQLSILGKVFYTSKYEGDKHTCNVADWQQYLDKGKTYPDSLEECRSQNLQFYQQVMELIG